MKTLHNNRQGVVSLFTVIFLSVLLIVIITAFIRLMINSQRLAIDNDLSTRAYYAAEAGADDALVILKDAAKSGELSESTIQGGLKKCVSEDLNNEYDISYTCRFISLSSEDNDLESSETGALESGIAWGMDFYGAENVAKIKVSWHQKSQGDGALIPSGLTVGQNKQNWSGLPAIMRLQAVQYPASGGINSFAFQPGHITNNDPGDITNSVTFAYPIESSADSNINIASSKDAAQCNYAASDDDYACEAIFTGFAPSKFKYIRLRAINNKAHFKLVLLDSADNPIAIPNQVIVDVTGKAGDVYRRIRVKASVSGQETGGGGGDTWNINHALLIDEDICKQLEVDPDNGRLLKDDCAAVTNPTP